MLVPGFGRINDVHHSTGPRSDPSTNRREPDGLGSREIQADPGSRWIEWSEQLERAEADRGAGTGAEIRTGRPVTSQRAPE